MKGMDSQFLISGGTGFLGRELVKYFKSKGFEPTILSSRVEIIEERIFRAPLGSDLPVDRR